MALALHPAITILIAFAPAAFSIWWSRAVARLLDDPALPERLVAQQRRSGAVFGVSTGLLIVTAPERIFWALPLLLLARMTAAYPIRKTLHHETWGLGTYLSFFLRLIVATFGLWLLIAALPALATRAGARDWIVACALGAIVVAWNTASATVFRRVLRTTPVDVPAINSRFAQLMKDCGLTNVKLDKVNLRGGVLANAVALPSIQAPAVVVTDTLMARLDQNEITAILAHELAHLEHYNPQRLRYANYVTWTLIGVGVLLAPLMRLVMATPMTPQYAFLIWPVVLLGSMLLRLQHRQKHETESDLRAVALTGDPEALVRALTKLHVFARVPRRWEAEFERRATHPSLARRIQAIRQASGTAPASITEPSTFIGAGTATSVTFREDRLEWNEGASMTHAIDYGHLSELRIDARSSSAPRLVAVDTAARRWEMPLQAADIVRAQSTLDIIDVRLGRAAEPSLVPPGVTRLVILLVMVGGMAVGQMSVFFTALLALLQPATQIAVAAGVAALAAAGVAWRDQAWWQLGDFGAWPAATLALCGLLLIGWAIATRHTAARANPKLFVLLAVCTSLAWTITGLSGARGLDLHRSAREWPSITILTLACAGALAMAQTRRLRWAALPVAVIGMLSGYAGSTSFVDRFVSDPFIASAPAITVKTAATSPLALTEFSIAFPPSRLWLSPAGGYVALGSGDARDLSTIQAGPAAGPLATFSADVALFVSESRLLLLERLPRGSVLHLVELAEGDRELWSIQVPVRLADLSIDRSSDRWRLIGWDSDDIVSAQGKLGDKVIQQTRWKSPANSDDLEILAMSHGVVLALETRHDYSTTQSLLPLIPFLWSMPRAESRFWSLSDRDAHVFSTSRVELTCHRSAMMDSPPSCAAFDGTRTRFFAVHPETEQLTPLASIAGRLFVSGIDDRGWLAGWWDQTPVVLHAATVEAMEMPDRAGERAYQAAIGDSVIAAVFSNGRSTTVRVYSRTH